jgi:hypothetical protein
MDRKEREALDQHITSEPEYEATAEDYLSDIYYEIHEVRELLGKLLDVATEQLEIIKKNSNGRHQNVGSTENP